MPGFDLKYYLDRFSEVCKQKFGRTYSFHALEKKIRAALHGQSVAGREGRPEHLRS